MNLKNVTCTVFDLDGTLIQSHVTIYKTAIETFSRLNIPVSFMQEELNQYIGGHFKTIFDNLNIKVPDLDEFIRIYKSIYFDFIDDSKIYPGTIELLELLKQKNISIALLTTKAQDQADLIIDHFNLRKYFISVMGRRDGLPVKPSPEPLKTICNEVGTDTANTVMIGDSEYDIKCGKNAGAITCGVTFGYRELEMLKLENPDFLVSSMNELQKLFE